MILFYRLVEEEKKIHVQNQNIEKIVRKSLLQTISNKVNTASMTTRGQEENIDLITIVNFVEQALATLSKYR